MLNNDSVINSASDDEPLITETGESYRDRVAHIDKKGRRVWIFPNKPAGRFHKARLAVGYFLFALYVALPFIKVNGEPFFLIDLLNRKFIIFGAIWWTHDFYILAITLLAFAVFIVLFTAIFGRVFCGWACPQIIAMELIVRKFEYLIEGDAQKQKALKKATWNASKILKKLSKHLIFLALAFIVNAMLVSYIFGIDLVLSFLAEPSAEHWGKLTFLVVLTLAFYGNYAWFREQACTYVCPYGRLQSVLLDKNSVIVGYDYKRGEPRGKLKGGAIQDGNGSCIDCGNCVRVCPTGIDIRNGVQLECVGCTNCIDACDKIMDSFNQPRGLVKYTSLNNIETGQKFKITPRIIFYSLVLTVLLTILLVSVFNRGDVEVNILRAKGSTYILKENGNAVNIFTMKAMNKTFDKKSLVLKTKDQNGVFTFAGLDKLSLEPDGILEATFLLEIPLNELSKSKNNVIIEIYENDNLIDKVTTTFSVP